MYQPGDRMKSRIAVLVYALLLLAPASLFAQDVWKEGNGKEITGLRAMILNHYNDARKKVIDLATAMPDDKFSWRPMEGVRSVSEVYMHIAGSNYLLPSLIGYKAPKEIKRDDETDITEKAKVVEYVKKSFDYVRDVLLKVPESDFDKPANFFGEKTTYRGVLVDIVAHWHEHLGQSVAYARVNKVVPPWTAAEQAPNPPPKK
jgi:uncharacterized damage-inducible protein DinB